MPETERGIERSCIACRKKDAQQALIRYVVGPDGRVVVDYRNRLPGRGAYTCIDRSCVERAVHNNAFARAFRGRAVRPETGELIARIRLAIAQRIAGLIGIAGKAGETVEGRGRVEAALKRGELAAVLIDVAAPGASVAKLARLAENTGVDHYRLSLAGEIGRNGQGLVGIRKRQFADLMAQEIIRLQQIAGEN